jgi:hypothetical protein
VLESARDKKIRCDVLRQYDCREEERTAGEGAEYATRSPTSASPRHHTFSLRHDNIDDNELLQRFCRTSTVITMSAESTPINAARFAAALKDLPISSLYAKHAELTNNITHLESSNKQLEDFARENDDRDCYEALLENRQVMKNFNERMELIRKEVEEVRGLPWRPQNEGEVRKEEGAIGLNGASTVQNGTGPTASTVPATSTATLVTQGQTNGSSAQADDEEEGVYL